MRIDSHVHFWEYEAKEQPWIDKRMKALKEDFLPPTLLSTLKRNELDACIAVSANQSELETHFLIELAKSNSFIKAVIGWIDFNHPDFAQRYEYFSQYEIIKGWCHKIYEEAPGYLLKENVQQNMAAIAAKHQTYELLISPAQLQEATQLAKRFPEQTFVLVHMGKPSIREKEINQWQADIEAMAAQPNVVCKLSGLFTEAEWKEWSSAEFYPYLEVVFKCFGTDRLLFGSDWPILLLSGIYVQWKSLLEKYMEHYSPEEKEKVFGLNAQRIYQL